MVLVKGHKLGFVFLAGILVVLLSGGYVWYSQRSGASFVPGGCTLNSPVCFHFKEAFAQPFTQDTEGNFTSMSLSLADPYTATATVQLRSYTEGSRPDAGTVLATTTNHTLLASVSADHFSFDVVAPSAIHLAAGKYAVVVAPQQTAGSTGISLNLGELRAPGLLPWYYVTGTGRTQSAWQRFSGIYSNKMLLFTLNGVAPNPTPTPSPTNSASPSASPSSSGTPTPSPSSSPSGTPGPKVNYQYPNFTTYSQIAHTLLIPTGNDIPLGTIYFEEIATTPSNANPVIELRTDTPTFTTGTVLATTANGSLVINRDNTQNIRSVSLPTPQILAGGKYDLVVTPPTGTTMRVWQMFQTDFQPAGHAAFYYDPPGHAWHQMHSNGLDNVFVTNTSRSNATPLLSSDTPPSNPAVNPFANGVFTLKALSNGTRQSITGMTASPFYPLTKLFHESGMALKVVPNTPHPTRLSVKVIELSLAQAQAKNIEAGHVVHTYTLSSNSLEYTSLTNHPEDCGASDRSCLVLTFPADNVNPGKVLAFQVDTIGTDTLAIAGSENALPDYTPPPPISPYQVPITIEHASFDGSSLRWINFSGFKEATTNYLDIRYDGL